MPDPFTLAAAGLTAASRAVPLLWDELIKRIKSAKDEKELSVALDEAIQVIVCQKNDYENNVKSHPLKVPSETYRYWVAMVKEIEEEAKVLQMKRSKKSKIAFFKRPGSMEEMQKLGDRVDKLKQAGDQLEGKLFMGSKIETVVRKNEAPDIRRFHTLEKPLEDVLALLKNGKVYKIGICGPLGIGKTIIMENLNNHEEVAKLFDVVIWIKVSTQGNKDNYTIERIQEVICQRLKLDLDGSNEPGDVKRAISMVLSDKKYLLLLDDVKEPPDLEKMGILPNKYGSKVVLTTRLHYVCSLAVDRKVKVSYLTIDEAWKMFQDVLKQPKLIKDSKIGPLAWRVCKECSGLPLLVQKVASTFRLMNSEQDWDDGLRSWRMWPVKERRGLEELYNLFKFCYDALDDDHQKKCFLFGALYPEDTEIYSDYLLECWAAEDLLSKHTDKWKLAHQALKRLKNVSLFEEGKTEDHVTMHRFIRQVALYILEHDSELKHLVKTNGALWEPLDVKQWLEKNRISLGDSDLDKLPDSPNCKELYTLFLQKNLGLEEIPASFFEYMENLRVLDLSHTGIMSLPPSLLVLIKLKILYLNNCKHLKSLPSDITKLEHLEALDVRGSGIVNVPDYIGDLINLRRLRVSFSKYGSSKAPQGNHFNHDIISKLNGLEELAIDVRTPDEWSGEVEGGIVNAVAPLKHFKTLKFFFPDKVVDSIDAGPKTLRIRVTESKNLLSFIRSSRWGNIRNIKVFQFFISDKRAEFPELVNFMKYDKYVKFCGGKGSEFPMEVISAADAFELVNHKDIKQLPDINIASMHNIQSCLVAKCDAFETLVVAKPEVVLPNLEHLYLKSLPKLKSICDGSMKCGSLSRIKTLVLISCHLLTEIFPSGVIEQLCQLEHLKIEDCGQVSKVFPTVVSRRVLPNLRKLRVLGVPKLTEICVTNALNWPSLEKLKISKCPELKKLPFTEVNATELKLIKAEQQWWDSIQWLSNEKTKEHLEKFCILS